jgi:hypothetical protein
VIPVYAILHDWPALAAIVGTRIYRAFAGDTPTAPYVVWRTLADVPDNHLSGPPPSDRYSIRVDCFADTEAGSDALAIACRDAIEQAGQVQNIQDLGREPDTKLWRYTIDADIFRNR